MKLGPYKPSIEHYGQAYVDIPVEVLPREPMGVERALREALYANSRGTSHIVELPDGRPLAPPRPRRLVTGYDRQPLIWNGRTKQ